MAKGKKKDDDGKEEPSWKARKGGSGGNTPPTGGKSTASRKTCGNGHTANSEGKCFTSGCPYYVRS